jgi:hypothetical protein
VSDDRLWEEPVQVKFRPSYSATSLNCPGSLLASLAAPDSSGVEAAVGTLFHRLIAEWQLTGIRPDHLVGQEFVIDGHLVAVDDEMLVHAQTCLERYEAIPGTPQIEARVDISALTPIPGQSGTADRVHVYPGTVEIIDWKYGKGVQVFSRWNTQLLCYAIGALSAFDEFVVETIRLHIAQPRLDHFDVWEISRDELELWAAWARAQWQTAWQPDAPRIPSGKACQWCRVRIDCPARQAMLERVVNETFDEVVTADDQQTAVAAEPPSFAPPVPYLLSTQRLAWIYQYRRTFELWFKEIGEELIRRGQQGEALTYWKIVEGRLGNRAWVDEHTAATSIARLGVSPYPDTLASPAEIERRLAAVGIKGKAAKQFVALYTDRAPGKLTLVPAQDNRLATSAVVEETFNPE